MANFKQYLEDAGYGNHFTNRLNSIKRDIEDFKRELDFAVYDAEEHGYEVDDEIIKKEYKI